MQNDGVYISDLEALTDVSKAVFKTMAKNGIIEIREEQMDRNPFAFKKVEKDKPKKLTEEQKKCFYGIAEDIEKSRFSKNLICGITGSRKNRNLFTTYSKSNSKSEKLQLF